MRGLSPCWRCWAKGDRRDHRSRRRVHRWSAEIVRVTLVRLSPWRRKAGRARANLGARVATGPILVCRLESSLPRRRAVLRETLARRGAVESSVVRRPPAAETFFRSSESRTPIYIIAEARRLDIWGGCGAVEEAFTKLGGSMRGGSISSIEDFDLGSGRGAGRQDLLGLGARKALEGMAFREPLAHGDLPTCAALDAPDARAQGPYRRLEPWQGGTRARDTCARNDGWRSRLGAWVAGGLDRGSAGGDTGCVKYPVSGVLARTKGPISPRGHSVPQLYYAYSRRPSGWPVAHYARRAKDHARSPADDRGAHVLHQFVQPIAAGPKVVASTSYSDEWSMGRCEQDRASTFRDLRNLLDEACARTHQTS